MSRVDDLQADFEYLGQVLPGAQGTEAAAIVRERRLLGELIDRLGMSEGSSFVDELAAKRSGSKSSRPPARRRRSG